MGGEGRGEVGERGGGRGSVGGGEWRGGMWVWVSEYTQWEGVPYPAPVKVAPKPL